MDTIFNNYTPLRLYFNSRQNRKIRKSNNTYFEALQEFDPVYALSVLKGRKNRFFEGIASNNYKLLEKAIHKEIPAYIKFKKGNEIFIDKENYLSKYPAKELLPNPFFDHVKFISVSSGSSGKPYFWPRGEYLELETTIIYELILKDFFEIDKKSTLVIDAYSMGMYVAGVFTLNACLRIALRGYRLSVITPGISLESIIRIIEEIGKNYEQIVICGYPPFVKDVIEEGARKGIDWKDHKLRFIFGAEAISEEWREYVYKEAGITDYYRSSINTYGSADAAILGHETPLSILIKKISSKNPKLLEGIFHGRSVSTFVQYHPQLKYFETFNNELICSTIGGLPLLRYNLHDSGEIYSFAEMINIMSEAGIDILSEAKKLDLPVWQLPFISLFGKSDQTITLYGLNIYPQTVRKGLEHMEIIKKVTTRMTMSTEYDSSKNQYMKVEVELNEGVEKTKDLEEIITNKIFDSLIKYNYEYKTLVEKVGLGRAMPRTILMKYGSIAQDRGSKQKWIK